MSDSIAALNVKLDDDVIRPLGDLSENLVKEIRNRRWGNILTAILLIVVALGVLDNRRTSDSAHQAAVQANLAATQAKAAVAAQMVQGHNDAVARCVATNTGRANLRETIDAVTLNLAEILQSADQPNPLATQAQREATQRFFNQAQASITATDLNAKARFPDLNCANVP